MTDRATLEALLARVLEGTGPDRELDAEIAKAFGWIERYEIWWPPEIVKLARKRKRAIYNYKMYSLIQARRYTASLDAALTLVPDEKAWTVGQNVHHWYWSASVNALDEDGAPKSIGWGGPSNSPALALCAAALQARMEALGE